MTKKPRTASKDGTTAHRLDIQRIRVNVQGYDSTGDYWGEGPDVFVATSAGGADEITVRAGTLKEARDKVTAELARQPGEARESKDAIGGNAPRKTRYEITWTNPATSERITIRITHAREYLSSGSDHLEIESLRPKKAPLPITETGYRSHFIPALDLMNAGGPVTFVTAWINQEAKGKIWTKAATAKQQADLFQWAEARGEVAKPKKSPTRKRPDGTPSRRPTKDRDPA